MKFEGLRSNGTLLIERKQSVTDGQIEWGKNNMSFLHGVGREITSSDYLYIVEVILEEVIELSKKKNELQATLVSHNLNNSTSGFFGIRSYLPLAYINFNTRQLADEKH